MSNAALVVAMDMRTMFFLLNIMRSFLWLEVQASRDFFVSVCFGGHTEFAAKTRAGPLEPGLNAFATWRSPVFYDASGQLLQAGGRM
jgi:hypothetical protein